MRSIRVKSRGCVWLGVVLVCGFAVPSAAADQPVDWDRPEAWLDLAEASLPPPTDIGSFPWQQQGLNLQLMVAELAAGRRAEAEACLARMVVGLATLLQREGVSEPQDHQENPLMHAEMLLGDWDAAMTRLLARRARVGGSDGRYGGVASLGRSGAAALASGGRYALINGGESERRVSDEPAADMEAAIALLQRLPTEETRNRAAAGAAADVARRGHAAAARRLLDLSDEPDLWGGAVPWVLLAEAEADGRVDHGEVEAMCEPWDLWVRSEERRERTSGTDTYYGSPTTWLIERGHPDAARAMADVITGGAKWEADEARVQLARLWAEQGEAEKAAAVAGEVRQKWLRAVAVVVAGREEEGMEMARGITGRHDEPKVWLRLCQLRPTPERVSRAIDCVGMVSTANVTSARHDYLEKVVQTLLRDDLEPWELEAVERAGAAVSEGASSGWGDDHANDIVLRRLVELNRVGDAQAYVLRRPEAEREGYWRQMVILLAGTGRVEEAIEVLGMLEPDWGRVVPAAALSAALAWEGSLEASRAMANLAVVGRPDDMTRWPLHDEAVWYLAAAAALRGEPGEAAAYVERGIQSASNGYTTSLKHEKRFHTVLAVQPRLLATVVQSIEDPLARTAAAIAVASHLLEEREAE